MDTVTAHSKMLCNLCNQIVAPSEIFLAVVQSSCLAQQMADLSYDVLWSGHLLSLRLLSCLSGILRIDMSIGAQAEVFNPQIQYLSESFPDIRDSVLGSVQSWPAG